MEPGRGLTTRPWVVPAVIAVAVSLAAVAAFSITRSGAGRGDRAGAQAAAFAHAASIDAQLKTDAAALAAAGQSIADATARLDVSRFAARDGLTVRIALPGDADLAARPEWRLALQLAADGGDAVAVAARAPKGDWMVLEARPLYGDGPPPPGVAERRQRLQGFAVALQPARSVALVARPAIEGHVVVRLLQGTTVLAQVRDDRSAARTPRWIGAAPVNGGTWTIEAWPVPTAPLYPYGVLFGGLFLAALLGAVVRAGERARDDELHAATARADELSVVARMGPLLQQSLDVAELLPLFVVEIADALHLEETSISLIPTSGKLVRAFSLGNGAAPADIELATLAATPSSVAAGEPVAVPLQRGGRIVGALTARATRDLTDSQVRTLAAACDLLAAALGNAELLQEQQAVVTRLRDVDRLKANFLGAVSHELRTMVIAIQGFADLLVTPGTPLDEERRTDFLQRIRRNARSLGVLVEDLLDFARLESAGLSVSVRPVDLADLVPKVVDQMSPILGARPVTTNVTPGVVALTDPAAVERILVNLLANAAKYTPAGTEVTIDVTHEDEWAVLCVSDRGPGIPSAERERIFDLFYRIDNESSRAARGVGIGLALARQLVELLEATITAEEAPGGGARFRLSLPLAETTARATPPARPISNPPVLERSPADVHAS